MEQLVSDTIEVTHYLRKRFGQEKIYLMGHSWGSFLGIQAAARAPELYHAYIGVAQMTRQLESEKLACQYMVQQYTLAGNNRMVQRLGEFPIPELDHVPNAYRMLRDEAMHDLGIGTTRTMKSVVSGIFWPVNLSGAYTLREKIDLWRGKWSAHSRNAWNEMVATDITAKVPKLDLPVYFLYGMYEYTDSYTLAKDYFDPHRQREQFVRTIGVVFGHRSQLWWDIAVHESFRLLQRIYRVPEADYRTYFPGEVVEVLDIGQLMATPVRKLSLGQRMRCELAAALLHRPAMLFLDEPTIGLDVSVKLTIREFLQSVNQRYGTTILLTTHDLSDIEALCHRVVMLDRGRIVNDGLLHDLRQNWAGERTVRVLFGEPVDLTALGRPATAEDGLTWQIPLGAEEALSDLLAQLIRLGPVRDLTVMEASMEEIVRRMYEHGGAV